MKTLRPNSDLNDDWIKNVPGYNDVEVTDKALRRVNVSKAIIRAKGGKGSGHHGHAGRPGKVGGSVSSNISNTLAAHTYDKFSKSPDKKKYMLDSIRSISVDLGLKTAINSLDNAAFNKLIENAARRAQVYPEMVKAVYTYKSDTITFRDSKIESIKSKTDFRQFTLTAFHELGHAFAKMRNKVYAETISSEDDYDNSKNEDIADIFSSRLGIAWDKIRGIGFISQSLRLRDDIWNYIEEAFDT